MAVLELPLVAERVLTVFFICARQSRQNLILRTDPEDYLVSDCVTLPAAGVLHLKLLAMAMKKV